MSHTVQNPGLRKLAEDLAHEVSKAQSVAVEIENRVARLQEHHTRIVILAAKLGNEGDANR